MPTSARSVFTIAAAALAGGCLSACAARWWARRTPDRPLPSRQAAGPAAPQETLRGYWSTLQPLDLTS
ncbi:hypothetical protein [Streptomyces anandii]|uniref:hypothetical protein n=1 Tax=Streptomyces anandii TaxID=285454 RepID=UPI00167B8D20|nr:hypothetical protein [Streptomyces anandii]